MTSAKEGKATKVSVWWALGMFVYRVGFPMAASYVMSCLLLGADPFYIHTILGALSKMWGLAF